MAGKHKPKKDKNKVTDIRTLPVAREAKVRANNGAAFETARDLFDLSWLDGFEDELAAMNRNKVGAPFRFTDSMIFWISLIMSYLDMDFRKAAGLAAGFLKSHGYPFPDYSTLKKRSDVLAATGVLGAPPEDARVVARYVRADVSDRIRRCAIDSTGLNLSKTTLWRMTRWKADPGTEAGSSCTASSTSTPTRSSPGCSRRSGSATPSPSRSSRNWPSARATASVRYTPVPPTTGWRTGRTPWNTVSPSW